jgi:hypothetical protein
MQGCCGARGLTTSSSNKIGTIHGNYYGTNQEVSLGPMGSRRAKALRV